MSLPPDAIQLPGFEATSEPVRRPWGREWTAQAADGSVRTARVTALHFDGWDPQESERVLDRLRHWAKLQHPSLALVRLEERAENAAQARWLIEEDPGGRPWTGPAADQTAGDATLWAEGDQLIEVLEYLERHDVVAPVLTSGEVRRLEDGRVLVRPMVWREVLGASMWRAGTSARQQREESARRAPQHPRQRATAAEDGVYQAAAWLAERWLGERVEDGAQLRAHAQASMPRGLLRLLSMALDPDPRLRPRDLGSFRAAYEALRKERRLEARWLSPRAVRRLWARRAATLTGFIVLAVLLKQGVSSFLAWSSSASEWERFQRGEVESIELLGPTARGRFGSDMVIGATSAEDEVPTLLVGAPSAGFGEAMERGAVHLVSLDQARHPAPLQSWQGPLGAARSGHRLLAAGDLDGDLVEDYWAMDGQENHPLRGRIHALSGATLQPIPGRALHGEDYGGVVFRKNFATVADRDGDGLRDLLVGARFGVPAERAVRGGHVPEAKSGDGQLLLIAADDGELLGRFHHPDSHATDQETRNREGTVYPFKIQESADHDGDGISDLLVTNPRGLGELKRGGSSTQRVGQVLLLSGADPNVELHRWTGRRPKSGFGSIASILDDYTGDGVPEIGIGSGEPPDGNAVTGQLQVFDGARWSQEVFLVQSIELGDRFGHSLALIGDLTGDGFREVAVGASSAQGGGAVHIYDLMAAPSPAEHQPIWTSARVEVLSAELGYPVRRLPDVDGDGIDDFAAGLAAYRTRERAESGAVRVYSSRYFRELLRIPQADENSR